MTERTTLRGHTTFDEVSQEASSVRGVSLPDVIDGRYRVLGRVGAGTMGIVLRCEDLFLQRPVAIKIVDPGVDPQVTERFVKEAQALAQIRHENVVQVYAFGRFQQASYLAMELVIGQPLETIIDEHAAAKSVMELPRAIAILRGAAAGLEAVHARSMIHRDVKPGNIIIEKNTDRPVLIDFGLARRRNASNPRLSITGGTPSYMAPEQATDPTGATVSSRTDVYAFACTIFEVLTGRPLFEGNDIYTVLLAHMNDPPRKISTVRPELAPLDDVLLRALAKSPEDRYATATELMDALEPRTKRIGVPPSGPRVMVLASEPGFRRSLVRNTLAALKSKDRDLEIVEAESAASAIAHGEKSDFALIVIDEESAEGRTSELIARARTRRPDVDVVVLSRDLPATTAHLGGEHVRHLVPKPLNARVLSAVLGRTSLASDSPRSAR